MTNEEFARAYAKLTPERQRIMDAVIYVLHMEQLRKKQGRLGMQFNWFLLALAKARGNGR